MYRACVARQRTHPTRLRHPCPTTFSRPMFWHPKLALSADAYRLPPRRASPHPYCGSTWKKIRASQEKPLRSAFFGGLLGARNCPTLIIHRGEPSRSRFSVALTGTTRLCPKERRTPVEVETSPPRVRSSERARFCLGATKAGLAFPAAALPGDTLIEPLEAAATHERSLLAQIQYPWLTCTTREEGSMPATPAGCPLPSSLNCEVAESCLLAGATRGLISEQAISASRAMYS